MLIIAGWLRVEPDARDRYLQECRQVVALARAAPGCLDFSLSADLLDPARINVYERWAGDERPIQFENEYALIVARKRG